MSSYNYNTISDSDGSLQEKFLEYSKTWEDPEYKEKKRVKIITRTITPPMTQNNNSTADNTLHFEKMINTFIISHQSKIKIFDIKYNENSVMIIYESLNIKN